MDEGARVTAYMVDVSCPRCGDPVEHVTAGATGPVVTLATRTVCRCARCRVEWLLVLELAPADREHTGGNGGNPAMEPCGTNAAYARHVKRGEPACQPCRDAHRIYVAGFKRSHKRKVDA
jgi:hypothetical protein